LGELWSEHIGMDLSTNAGEKHVGTASTEDEEDNASLSTH
jgi:hypothetical protein